MIHRSPLAPVDIPLMSLPAFVLQRAEEHPDKPALIDGLTGRRVTYGELASLCRRAAAGLASSGFGKGDVLAIWSPNLPEYPVAFYGAALAGGAVTTINPLFNAIELAHQLRDAGARTLITSPPCIETARRAAASAGVTNLYVFGEAEGAAPFASLLEAGAAAPRVDLDPRGDVVALLYSSATTGLPKGVMLTHRNLVANILQMSALERMAETDVVMGVVPFYHAYGLNVVMNMALRTGATVVTLPRFEVQPFLDAAQRYAVTTAFLVPPIVHTLATHPLVDDYDLSHLQHVLSAAAPLPEAAARTCAARIGCVIRQLYGLTETGGAIAYTPRGGGKLNSTGLPVPSTEIRVVDAVIQGDVGCGELGEVWVRGPQVMQGYLNNPEVSQRVIDGEGWLHTGDIGYTDADGYVYVLDRVNDLVKFRGLQYRDGELLLTTIEDRVRRRDDEQRLRFQALLLDSVRDSIVGIDNHHAVTFWNKGAEALFGYTAEEAMGVQIERLILLEDEGALAPWRDEMAQLAAQGKWKGQVQRRRKDGSLLWAEIVASVVKTPEGQDSGHIAIHRDITELRRSQEMLRESHERLQNLAVRLMDIREQERSVIARELHDELGQALTRLNIDLCWLTGGLPRRLLTKRTASMVAMVEDMLSTVQHLSSRLRPGILDDLGLEAAIEWQAQEFQSWNGCRCRVDLQIASLGADRERDTAVFRILQEALTNVARHAHATSVEVGCRIEGPQLCLDVEDDGVGIPPGELGRPRSLGLFGMRERARGIGGSIQIEGGLAGGTAVRLRVPLQPAPDGRS
jgi:PAS domain S-box-containing protein